MAVADEDPVVRSARREAIAVLTLAACALTYTVLTCSWMGYGTEPRELRFVHLFGGIAFPDWVFWGIVVPWSTCFVIGSAFALVIMQDADLGEELQDEDDPFCDTSTVTSTGSPTHG